MADAIDNAISAASSPPNFNRRLTELTISEIIEYQNNGSLYAVGKYQGVGRTLREWVSRENISENAVFNGPLQERFGDYLIGPRKRRRLHSYLNGSPAVTVEQAQLDLAKEFEAMPVPGDPDSNDSYYGEGKTRRTSGETREILIRARETGNFQLLKDFIAAVESSPDDAIAYDTVNIGRGRPLVQVGDNNYLRAVNGLEYQNQNQQDDLGNNNLNNDNLFSQVSLPTQNQQNNIISRVSVSDQNQQPIEYPTEVDTEYLQRRSEAQVLSRIATQDNDKLVAEAEDLEIVRDRLRRSIDYFSPQEINKQFKKLYKLRQQLSRKDLKEGIIKYTYPVTERDPVDYLEPRRASSPSSSRQPIDVPDLPLKRA